jgi:hypothetical protein
MVIQITSGLNSIRRRKVMNMSKVTEVLQGPDESHSQFYERLCEAFNLYIPFHPEVTKNQRTINAAFVSQAHGNIDKNYKILRDFLV